ncbi:hypothetical protein MTO96_019940 [Rhipicephalus appendiculatus]
MQAPLKMIKDDDGQQLCGLQHGLTPTAEKFSLSLVEFTGRLRSAQTMERRDYVGEPNNVRIRSRVYSAPTLYLGL